MLGIFWRAVRLPLDIDSGETRGGTNRCCLPLSCILLYALRPVWASWSLRHAICRPLFPPYPPLPARSLPGSFISPLCPPSVVPPLHLQHLFLFDPTFRSHSHAHLSPLSLSRLISPHTELPRHLLDRHLRGCLQPNHRGPGRHGRAKRIDMERCQLAGEELEGRRERFP